MWVRYARWDPAGTDLVDGQTGERLCALHPVDRRGNADGARRPAAVDAAGGDDGSGEDGLPPLLRTMLDVQAATGLPPAWVAHTPDPDTNDDQDENS